MGKPLKPTDEQYAELEKAGQLAQLNPSEKINVSVGSVKLKIKLPRKAVSLLIVDFTS
jgi:xylan 1,4-beta-xylosidase